MDRDFWKGDGVTMVAGAIGSVLLAINQHSAAISSIRAIAIRTSGTATRPSVNAKAEPNTK